MKKQILLLVMLGLVSFSTLVQAERLKDLADVQGVRNNQLLGYGLIVGLNGTGDNAPFTNQTFKNMMKQFGITLPPGVKPNSKNVAAVTVSATLPPFAKPGQTIDITVSSIGNAKSLRGGTLLLTALRGADGNVYAVAQGSIVVGGVMHKAEMLEYKSTNPQLDAFQTVRQLSALCQMPLYKEILLLSI